MTTDMRELARVTMAAKVLADAAKDEGTTAREQLLKAMRSSGVERLRVTGEDDADFGAVVLTAGARSMVVVDETLFQAWVAERYPEQIMPSVRPAFRARLLSAAARKGDPVDVETGEVIPGVALSQGDPYLAAKPTETARGRMRTALAGQNLLLPSPADGESV